MHFSPHLILFKEITLFVLKTNDSFRNEDDFLVQLLLMGAAFAVFAAIIAVSLVLIVSFILFFMLSAGIISTSLLVGFQQKSVGKGFRTFFILASIVGSIVISVIFFWLLNSVYDFWITEVAVIAGILSGAATGWALGVIIFLTSKKIVIFMKNQLDTKLLKRKKNN